MGVLQAGHFAVRPANLSSVMKRLPQLGQAISIIGLGPLCSYQRMQVQRVLFSHSSQQSFFLFLEIGLSDQILVH